MRLIGKFLPLLKVTLELFINEKLVLWTICFVIIFEWDWYTYNNVIYFNLRTIIVIFSSHCLCSKQDYGSNLYHMNDPNIFIVSWHGPMKGCWRNLMKTLGTILNNWTCICLISRVCRLDSKAADLSALQMLNVSAQNVSLESEVFLPKKRPK